MKVKPKNAKVSGFPSPRSLRSFAAKRPNSIKRVLSGWSDSANSPSLSCIASRKRRASPSCSKPTTRSSAYRTTIISPRASCRLQRHELTIRAQRAGLRVSAVGLGCNNFGQRIDLEASRKVIHKAIDLGITLFDTADIYAGLGGSETVLGAVLGDRRKDIVLATKYSKPMASDGGKQGASRRYIMSAVEASLTRLKTDYIDLYQQHDYDSLTPIEETLRALDDLVRQGKVRYIGNSNFPAWRIAEAEYVARAINVNRFVSCQDEYSLVVRDIEKDLVPVAQQYGLGLLPFFPLASGLLTGKYKRGPAAPDDTRFAKAPALKDRYATPRNEDIVEKLQAFTEKRGHS